MTTDGTLRRKESVENIDNYLTRARTLDRGEFVMAYRHLFLLKHPKPRQISGESWMRDLDGATVTRELQFDPVPDRMQLVVVKKSAGNENPWEFSIGRAVTCDVVLRFPFISKLHAHLAVGASGKISLMDRSSTGRTSRNGRPLHTKSAEEIQIGDTLSLGALDLELCDAERLHRLLANPQTVKRVDPYPLCRR